MKLAQTNKTNGFIAAHLIGIFVVCDIKIMGTNWRLYEVKLFDFENFDSTPYTHSLPIPACFQQKQDNEIILEFRINPNPLQFPPFPIVDYSSFNLLFFGVKTRNPILP